MRPISRARLATNRQSYRAESTVFARVENYGTVAVGYGVPYSIEHLEGESWVEAPESPKGPWILPLLLNPPGFSGRCNGFLVPPEMAAGNYRVVKEVMFGLLRPAVRKTLTAEFQVIP